MSHPGRQTDRYDRQMDGWMDGQMDGWTDGCMDRWMHGQMDAWTDGCMDRTGRMEWDGTGCNGQDRQTDRQMKEMNGLPYDIMVLITCT